jgi:hypothetical protein
MSGPPAGRSAHDASGPRRSAALAIPISRPCKQPPPFRAFGGQEDFQAENRRFRSLPPGHYFGQVAGLRDGVEVTTWRTSEFWVDRDTGPLSVEVVSPEAVVRENGFLLKGKTEPGAKVFVGGQSVPTTGNGEFEQRVPLNGSLNVVVIEAIDAVGNVAYQSHIVNSKY